MNKEVYHEGWLIKSPPTKRIWRARWRRRWFTLKQGEIPGQFCLEYYTDRNCRKLKGVIDLDQCEQVDCGLRMEHRKQKFQNMFDVKTPRRTYYLAADSEDDMNDWVKCICQVCNLQDLSKQSGDRQYYNVEIDALHNKPLISNNNVTDDGCGDVSAQQSDNLNETQMTTLLLQTSSSINSSASATTTSAATVQPATIKPMIETSGQDNIYQNDDFAFRNCSMYSNRATILCDAKLPQTAVPQTEQQQLSSAINLNNNDAKLDYYNLTSVAQEVQQIKTIERSQSMKINASNTTTTTTTTTTSTSIVSPVHLRAQSFIEQRPTGTIKKIPENLNLTDNFVDNAEPSPALSTCSGPYIPISECFSGSPVLLENDMPTTPLNSLDPRFYDTPRSHINIGLNLTNNEQPYSPKRNNCPVVQSRPRSGRSSPTDSESVFTDDEEWVHPANHEPLDRNLRPSDSSVENDSIVFTYAQRFSKRPDDYKSIDDRSHTPKIIGPPRPPKRVSGLMLDEVEDKNNKENLSSDTENASPAIGPKDVSCCVEESYDIPRSHHLPYYNLNSKNSTSPTLINKDDVNASSTPNLIAEIGDGTGNNNKDLTTRSHFYSNAAPSKIGGNVFRYDFIGQENAPIVNRSLKPKQSTDDFALKETKEKSTESVPKITKDLPPPMELRPPCIDRKLKPSTPKLDTSSLRRKTGVGSLSLSTIDNSGDSSPFGRQQSDLSTRTLPRNYNNTSSTMCTMPIVKPAGYLEYFDLDHSNPPPICQKDNSNNSSGLQTIPSQSSGLVQHSRQQHSTRSNTDLSNIFPKQQQHQQPIDNNGIVYKSVDFVKTEAIKRMRQDTELNRAKHTFKE